MFSFFKKKKPEADTPTPAPAAPEAPAPTEAPRGFGSSIAAFFLGKSAEDEAAEAAATA